MSQSRRAVILIVDHDPAVTEIFARMLALQGYEVHTALNAETGLREAEARHPDAILLDLRMPLVDGLAFLRRLRARESQRDTPVAVVTGDYFLDDTVRSELRDFGAALCFKPLWLEDLVRMTHRLLRGTMRDRLNLLLIDDCVAERDVYASALEMEFNILTASRGDEGLAVASRERPDVVVLDVMMPGMEGWEACTAIKCNPATADIPVILLARADDRDLLRHARAVGASALLRTPCPADMLRDTILAAVKSDVDGLRN